MADPTQNTHMQQPVNTNTLYLANIIKEPNNAAQFTLKIVSF